MHSDIHKYQFLSNSYLLEILEIIRSWKYLKVARKENLWAYGPKYRQSSREWPESWLELPTKFARMTGKHGLISLKGPGGAQNAATRSCTEGVRMLNLLIKMLRFLLQYNTLPCVKKRWGWGLPLYKLCPNYICSLATFSPLLLFNETVGNNIIHTING